MRGSHSCIDHFADLDAIRLFSFWAPSGILWLRSLLIVANDYVNAALSETMFKMFLDGFAGYVHRDGGI
jgi:hypothetical protein